MQGGTPLHLGDHPKLWSPLPRNNQGQASSTWGPSGLGALLFLGDSEDRTPSSIWGPPGLGTPPLGDHHGWGPLHLGTIKLGSSFSWGSLLLGDPRAGAPASSTPSPSVRPALRPDTPAPVRAQRCRSRATRWLREGVRPEARALPQVAAPSGPPHLAALRADSGRHSSAAVPAPRRPDRDAPGELFRPCGACVADSCSSETAAASVS